MTPTQREAALRLADDMDTPISVWADHVAHLLRELASEPVQEPVCWGWRVPDGRITMIFSERKDNPDLEVVPLFTHPPQQRKPLSEEQMKEVMSAAGVRVFQPGLWDVLVEAGRSIERHYGIGEAP